MHVRTYAYTPLLRPEAPVQVLGHWAHPPPLRLPGQHTAAGSGRHLELVRPQLVDVGAGSRLWLVPEAELEEQLVSPGQQHLAPLLSELQVLLRVGWGQAIWAQQPGSAPPPRGVPQGVVEAAPNTGLSQNQHPERCAEWMPTYLVVLELVHAVHEGWVAP